MKASLFALLACAGLLALQTIGAQAQKPAGPQTAEEVAASTYEHLANAIIAIETTEDELVKSILIGYQSAAQVHLRAAQAAGDEAAGAKRHLEMAAQAITNIANEGDKRIQAIRQRLAQAGHTHNTDVETKEDYMFVTSKERKQLVDLAQRVANAKPGDVKGLSASLTDLFAKVIAPE